VIKNCQDIENSKIAIGYSYFRLFLNSSITAAITKAGGMVRLEITGNPNFDVIVQLFLIGHSGFEIEMQ
jgi:hypothetical protein